MEKLHAIRLILSYHTLVLTVEGQMMLQIPRYFNSAGMVSLRCCRGEDENLSSVSMSRNPGSCELSELRLPVPESEHSE